MGQVCDTESLSYWLFVVACRSKLFKFLVSGTPTSQKLDKSTPNSDLPWNTRDDGSTEKFLYREIMAKYLKFLQY
jgi:hypothetical protein